MRVEILTDPMMVDRGADMIKALIQAAPVEVKVRQRYVGDCEILLTYGTGHPVRRPWWKEHRAKGGRCIGWDLGYWRRKEHGTFRMRATIDEDHPHAMIRPEPPERFDADGLKLGKSYRKDGHIILVGLTRKANVAVGMPALEWERRQYKRIKEIYPKRTIIFRPKRIQDPIPPGVRVMITQPIEHLLEGASLVVCRHSNVAVDACIAGVPVVCEDGAARAIYGSDLEKPRVPSTAARLEFLRSLAWWQWKPEEAKEAWTYLLTRIECG